MAKIDRENARHYICASDQEINEMLQVVGESSLDDLYQHIDNDVLFENFSLGEKYSELNATEIRQHIGEIANRNLVGTNFISKGLPFYSTPQVTADVCGIRGLTTAYTPYQPERSQGTLQSLWIYQSLMSALSGFEAVNTSLYERATALYEAINCAKRIEREKKLKIILSSGIYQNDRQVLETLCEHTNTELYWVPCDPQTGTTDLKAYKKMVTELHQETACCVFPQVNHRGLLEDVHTLNEIAKEFNCLSVAIVDPFLLGAGGLIPPSEFAADGADIIVGEGQHLALNPLYGGPGLGFFAVRFNENQKRHIRSTPGRYVGKAYDREGKECRTLVLSTREQHIRREKATSNICSNQSFIATVIGAALLERGDEGMQKTLTSSRNLCEWTLQEIFATTSLTLAYQGAFFNEFTLEIPQSADELVALAAGEGIHLAKSDDCGPREIIQICLTDRHSQEDAKKLCSFLKKSFPKKDSELSKNSLPLIQTNMRRKTAPGIKSYAPEKIISYYQKLGQQNIGPEDVLYPLGSCTMKYNPKINEEMASLPGFSDLHPEVHPSAAQGSLELLYHIQELFKKITGLAGVTTQPVAGAQGELVGIKLFQAYHQSRGEGEQRKYIIIPRSAHGTNPATVACSGYGEKAILTIRAQENGEMDLSAIKKIIAEKGSEIAGIMVTNPNTSGIFETQFKEMAQMIHACGGLVYMDGANMNAIAGYVDLGALGVDAVHNNLHKTWTIPHGGGGPGDAIVAVSDKLVDFLPGQQVHYQDGCYKFTTPSKSIGSFHRHHGNFAHKVRCYTYLRALGTDGIRKMAAIAVLSARYLHEQIKDDYPTLPAGGTSTPKMHEFIITLSDEVFQKISDAGIAKSDTIASIGKLFLDFGVHAPTVAFPETYGLMIEPTESFSQQELDRFIDILRSIKNILNSHPHLLKTAPHFTPIRRVQETQANKELCFTGPIDLNETPLKDLISTEELSALPIAEIPQKINEYLQ